MSDSGGKAFRKGGCVMNKFEIAQAVAQFHNVLTEVSVKGEDVLRMRDVIMGMRSLASTLTQEANEEANKEAVEEVNEG